eukprot:TRINITY_DN88085_c0_g1_i1.p1 TRINITY_DN88085_c0_g1~~TRINITY_DN88085_c0_g1_i1.p1  ORF type:complete len:434 (+),score=50.83 TRINITY_DN88085_c0_g1_i1:1927-3228(+)
MMRLRNTRQIGMLMEYRKVRIDNNQGHNNEAHQTMHVNSYEQHISTYALSNIAILQWVNTQIMPQYNNCVAVQSHDPQSTIYIRMASNRFAALSPDFEQEEAQRKQQAEAMKVKKEALKTTVEEKPKARPERKQEGKAPREDRRPGERGRGRGAGRPYRGRGGYRKPAETEGEFIPREKAGPREFKNFKFTGSNDPIHPFDRKSGTGRGTEIPKRGGGRRNWGNPADDWKNAQKMPEEQPEVEEKQVPAEEPKAEVNEAEKKPEAPKEPEVPVLTYSEYQAMIAEKQKGLPIKKAEVQVARDPKAVAGLVAYEKPQYSAKSQVANKKKEETKESPAEAEKTLVLGTFIAEEPRPPRRFERKAETEEPASTSPEGERRSPAGKRGRGGFKGAARREAKKAENTPFVMKEEDFPALAQHLFNRDYQPYPLIRRVN